jgi:predicted O-methyltransferase YrrM
MEIADLEDLEEGSRKLGIPIVGSEKGTWLLQLVQYLNPQRVLELGTANGYSGILLGSEGAELTTIEIDPKSAREAERNFAQYHTDARVVMGDGVEVVSHMVQDENNLEAFDLIFIDFAKKKYLEVLADCVLLCKVGGRIVADNSLMVPEYSEAALQHPQLHTELVKIKDGLVVSEKIS